MIAAETRDGIEVLTLQHGKANALDIEFCDALATRFLALRFAILVFTVSIIHAQRLSQGARLRVGQSTAAELLA